MRTRDGSEQGAGTAMARERGNAGLNWLYVGLGCAVGGALSSALCAALLLIAGLVLWGAGGGRSSTAGLTTAVEVTIEADGCTVTRTAVVSDVPLRNLQWVIEDAAGEQVLARAAEHETRYTYYRPGTYRVHLQAWAGGGYVPVSNEVTIRCP